MNPVIVGNEYVHIESSLEWSTPYASVNSQESDTWDKPTEWGRSVRSEQTVSTSQCDIEIVVG